MDDKVHDSPTGWVAKHIRQYVESDGAKGHFYYGRPALLLTTVGRKSGLRRRTPLIYGRDGDAYVVVASNGGAADHPLWYANLEAEPQVGVQVGAETFTAVARTATAEEKPALWEQMVGIHGEYADYQRKTSRDIPVVILTRV
ncbi:MULTISPECIES: nitroreductase family deazaflavin-dependent oxidoreductase [Streptosporangium]|uniref:Deazaflavin-dependent oxidoreductase (Nitroreductase family) n=1 Tax=Streptosporangium brasiliense TaxID=47480 RepID=A0ABT9RFK6_9ACTN|nr:nitroreductase family deazaflavin-dependent oxidoreductase [Streptosporangium brasiliense]MDP9868051.1 deazaflavin-dependent oxidoreductase (nitroreductase family) [Streptosporangium brasiliense]